MEIIIIAIGAYLIWRMASESGRPGQEPITPPPEGAPEAQPREGVSTQAFLDSRKVFLINRFVPIISDVAESLGMDPNLIKGLIYMSSSGDDAARIMQPDSEYGYGLTQITCGRARQIRSAYEGIEGVGELTDCLILDDPINSIWYGSVYLRSLYRGDWREALGKYYSPSEAIFPREDALERADITLAVAQAFKSL